MATLGMISRAQRRFHRGAITGGHRSNRAFQRPRDRRYGVPVKLDRVANVQERSVALVSLTPFYERHRARIVGLTDDEYWWQPAPNCLTVERGHRGPLVTGGPPTDGPLTTVAWRMCHIGDGLRSERTWRWLGREPELFDADIRHPMGAAAAIEYVDESWAAWQRLMASVTPQELWEPIGPVGGIYGESERIGLVIHLMDEFIHHSAEVALMRDLYAAIATAQPGGRTDAGNGRSA
jgi:hypothetical protein